MPTASGIQNQRLGALKEARVVNGPTGPGNCRRGRYRRAETLEDFVVLAGAEEFQLAGTSDIDQEPIAFAADMAFPVSIPLPFKCVVFVAPRQGLMCPQ